MKNLINDFDEIIRWPRKSSEKELIIKWLSEKFIFKKEYTELEVNQIIKQHHKFNDIAILRRELISKKYMQRELNGSKY